MNDQDQEIKMNDQEISRLESGNGVSFYNIKVSVSETPSTKIRR
jgi:hypothetical protein